MDRFIFGGRIATLDPLRAEVEAMLVRGGVIHAMGSEPEIRRIARETDAQLDLGGRVMLPALKDHHLHLVAIGFALLNRERGGSMFMDLSAVRSEAEMVDRVAARAARERKGDWIVGASWNEVLWKEMRVPTHQLLSSAVPDHPVFLVRVDSHSALVNAAAMRVAGITRQSAEPHGGANLRDSSGEPTGILLERGVEPVLHCMPVPDDDIVREAFRLAAASMAARGYSDVYDAGIMHFPGLVAMNAPMERWLGILCALDEEEGLPINVNLMIPAPSPLAERVLRGGESRQQSPRVRITHLKLYADGAFGSRGALMYQPYSDDPAMLGVSRMTEAEMYEYSRRALAVDLDVAVHAIGDVAVERVLNVFERLLAGNRALAPARLRLEHFSVATAADIQRAARMGILVVAQPGFVWPGPDGRCMEDYRLGPERVKRAYAWRSLLNLGARIAGSSDDYGLPPHPLLNFHAAVTRRNPEGIPVAGWQPEERITREEAMSMFTRLALPGGEFTAGVLREGEPARFALYSNDPLNVAADEILKLRVERV
jgi:predicted amidohydrolase YtcJ